MPIHGIFRLDLTRGMLYLNESCYFVSTLAMHVTQKRAGERGGGGLLAKTIQISPLPGAGLMHDTQYALYRTHESSESWRSTKRTKQKQWFSQKIGQLAHNKSESISIFLHYYNFFLVRDTRSNGTLAPSPHRTLALAIKALKPFCMSSGSPSAARFLRPRWRLFAPVQPAPETPAKTWKKTSTAGFATLSPSPQPSLVPSLSATQNSKRHKCRVSRSERRVKPLIYSRRVWIRRVQHRPTFVFQPQISLSLPPQTYHEKQGSGVQYPRHGL